MALRLADRWVWDFWLAADAGTWHLFYLQADRSLGDPDRRHWHASIGHAVSTDLKEWTTVADALAPAVPPGWDDHTVWTGNVVRAFDRWHLFYTGTSTAEDGLVQRVGHAVSADLTDWKRVGDGLAFELDARWYDLLDTERWHDQAWRDPVLIELAGEWAALVTARLNTGDPLRRGTIGWATSPDLRTWTVQPPLTGPTPFGDLEIPDVQRIDGTWYLLFSSASHATSTDGRSGAPRPGTFAVPSTAGPLGPWDWDQVHRILGDGWYGAKLITGYGQVAAEDGIVALAWRDRDGEGFGGWISDPLPVTVSDGIVTVHAAS